MGVSTIFCKTIFVSCSQFRGSYTRNHIHGLAAAEPVVVLGQPCIIA